MLQERQWKNFLEIYCTENTTFIALYWHILLVMAVWLPLAIMILCYSAIFIKVRKSLINRYLYFYLLNYTSTTKQCCLGNNFRKYTGCPDFEAHYWDIENYKIYDPG